MTKARTPWLRRGLVSLSLLVAVAALGVGGWRVYRSATLRDRVQLAPPPPAEAPVSTKVMQRLREAHRELATAEQPLAALADLGRLYHANGFTAEAEACWAILQQEQPAEGRWPYYRAELRRMVSDDGAMVQLWRQTVTAAPDYAPAWQRLGDQALKTGQPDEAAQAYRRRLALLPGDLYARLGLARLALQAGREDEARQAIAELVRDAPDFSPAQNLHAEWLAAAGDEAGARRHRWLGREAGRFRDPPDPWLDEINAWCFDPDRLQLLGTIAFQTARGDRGRSLLERAVEEAPENPVAHQLLGDLYLKLGEPALARRAFQESIARTPPDRTPVMAYVNLVEAHRLLGEPLEALRVIKEGLDRAPEAFELHNTLGAVLGDLGEVRAAAEAFREAVVRAPNDVDSNHQLGAALLALGEREEGVARLQHVLSLRPSYPQALALLGRFEMEQGRLESAGKYLQSLYDSNPGQEIAQVMLAQWHMRSARAAAERNDEASEERHYRAALELRPQDGEINAGWGVWLLVRGRVTEAVRPLELYREAQPENPRAALFLGQAYARTGRVNEAIDVLTVGERLAREAGSAETAAFCREILEHLTSRAAPPR